MATLDATLSGNQSNSYVTLENADGIASNAPFAAEWAAASEDDRVVALITATRWMETLVYQGTRCKASQRLSWPRNGAECDGVTSDCLGIPYPVQEAQVILAYEWIKVPGSFPGQGSGGSTQAGVYVSMQKLGDLQQEFTEYSNPQSNSCDTCGEPAIISSFPWLKDLLKCWYKGDGLVNGSGLMLRVRS